MRRTVFLLAALAAAAPHVGVDAQIPGRSVNMVAGTTLPDGDPFLQRQNESTIAVSSRNPCHLMAGSNDYRTVDLPGLTGDEEAKDAWLGVFKSYDCGETWRSTLVPGYPQDPNGAASPLFGRGAGADPTVRAGTNGLFYYLGLAFDRGANGLSKIFVARYIDRNQESGDSIAYLDTSVIDSGSSGQFLDKPYLAVDIPRAGARQCTVDGQTFPGGNVYAVYSSFVGNISNNVARLYVARSTNCGVTWTKGTKITEGTRTNQGATIAIDPATGAVYVAWRQFSLGSNQPDAILIAKSTDGGRTFSKSSLVSTLSPFDQRSGGAQFRTNAFPTMAVDGDGRIYLAWASRGFAPARPDSLTGDARIVMSTSTDGTAWTMPRAIDNTAAPGHQFMPALALAAGRLQLIYYDLREDHSFGTYTIDPITGRVVEQRETAGDLAAGHPEKVFWELIADMAPPAFPNLGPLQRRHTLDVRSAQAAPGPAPEFATALVSSERLSTYRIGGTSAFSLLQLEFNVPNLPLYAQGTIPFMGDYIDVAGQSIIPSGSGWAFSTQADRPAIFHAAWTDNRDVRPPVAPFTWRDYTPPTTGLSSVVCQAGTTGMRNANIYTSRITPGLVVSSPGNAKPLDPVLPRAFAVVVQNATDVTRHYRLTLPVPGDTRASFLQFPSPPLPDPLLSLDVSLAALSSAARTVWVTSTDPHAVVAVDVQEITAPGGSVVNGGNTGSLLLNPDATNPAITNPAITNETFNPAITNPAITNPAITNPAITNPAITNPAITNPAITNPAITNPAITNPAITNEEVADPAITNPAITNSDVANGVISDVTWTVTNTGNTAAAYAAKLVLNNPLPPGFKKQLVLHKTYVTPAVGQGCTLGEQNSDVLIANILNPTFTDLSGIPTSTITDPAITNATIALAPGEAGKITLRIVDPDRSNNVTVTDPETGKPISVDPAFDPREDVTTGVVAEAVNSIEAAAGSTQPPVSVAGATGLVFLTAPFVGLPNQPLQPMVRVQVRDSAGAPLPSVPVTLSLSTNPTGAVISGNTAVSDSLGRAQYPSLQIDRPGLGYVIQVTAGSTVVGFSTPFNILEACLANGVYTLNPISVEGPDINSLPLVTRAGANFDNDGAPDAAVLHGNGLITRMRNNGAGSLSRSFQFNAGPGFTGPTDLALGDFNEDGLTDVAVSFLATGNVGVSFSNLTPGGTPLTDVPFGVAANAIAAGDFDNDGNTDIAVVSTSANNLAIRYGNGDGTFDAVALFSTGVGSLPSSIALGDVNEDGITDLAVATSDTSALWVFLGATDRLIAPLGPYATGASAASVTLADFDADGHLDVAIADTTLPYEAVVAFGDGLGGFGPSAFYALGGEPASISAADFNSDGRQDLVVAISSLNEARVLFNNGNGTFGPPRSVPTSVQPVHAIGHDLNGDGRPELIVTNNNHVGICCDNIALVMASCGAITSNLVVAVGQSTPSAPVGGDVQFTTTVTNAGPFPATNVSLVQTMSSGTVTGASPTAGSCAAGSTTSCNLGTIAPGASVSVTIDLTMGAIGVTTSALATAAEVDLVPANNRAGAFIDVTAAVTFTVLNLSDSGPGSLRQAIVNANGNGNAAVADVIVFNIPGAGPFTIPLATPLPTITEPVNIDGTTQPGFGGSTRVHLSGGGIAGAGLFVGLTGGPSAIRGLSITGFSSQGIRLVGSGNVVVSNLIGLTPLGAAVPNGEGVFVDAGLNNTIGGPNASNRNVISGNNGHGVMITGGFDATGNAVLGNYIGTNIAGTAAVANGGAGVVVTARASAVGGPTAGMGNVIAGNGQNGITISADDSETTVQGNFIGTDASGTAAIPNAGNGIAISDTEFSVIGGTDPAARNIISGNGGNGISLTNDASATTIQGNHIGMNAAGTAAIPNLGNGVRINGTFSTLLGGSTPAARNLISANAGNGVVLDDSRNNDIVGNFIGTDVTGLVDFGNGGHGVAVINDSDSNRIGGSGGANLISENGFDGVSIDASSQRVEIGENSIHSNGGLGIDQNDDGPTIGDPQDLDVGSNDLQNYPDLASALSFGQIAGNLHSAVSSAFVVRFYSSPTCDATTQGETFRGSATINTDSAGNGAIVVFVGALTPGHGVTATATDAAGNTSEFSPCVVVSSPNEPAAGPVASAGLLGSGRQAPPGVRRDRIAGR